VTIAKEGNNDLGGFATLENLKLKIANFNLELTSLNSGDFLS
jgi:hypothetical protein